jgi:hypothetical protein
MCVRLTLQLLKLCLLSCSLSAPLLAAEEKSFRDQFGKEGKYTIEIPAKGTKIGVLVYFHGSGATKTYASNFREITGVATAFNLAAVALQAPDGAITWAEKGPPSGRIAYAQELLQKEVFGKSANLEPKKTIFVGVSAGSTFISGDFLPQFIGNYHGGAVLLCGGASPIYPPKLPPSINGFKMFMAIQKTDFLFAQAIAGMDFWQAFGVPIKMSEPPGAGHCAFDLYSAMREGIRFVLN